MKISKIVLTLSGAVLAFSAHADVSKRDQEFLQKAAVGGLYEVQAGSLAQSKGQSEGVQSFGAMLVKDHSAANEELKALAASKGITLPSKLPTAKQKRLEKISADQDFDKEFVKEVGLDDHMEDIRLFEKAGQNGDDVDVKAFAIKTLPTLKAHKEHAEGLKKSLNR
jgi:putative membrane protein